MDVVIIMSVEKFLALCSFYFSQSLVATRVDLAGEILKRNDGTAFCGELMKEKKDDLKLSAVLLGAQIKGGSVDKAKDHHYQVARMIDIMPWGKQWADSAINIAAIKGVSIEDLVSRSVLNDGESVEVELTRSVAHLVKHVVDRCHVISNIRNGKSDSSFFFLILKSDKEQLSGEGFLNALLPRLFDAFASAVFKEYGDSCVQATYSIEQLSLSSKVCFGISFYECDGFSFIPVNDGYIAKSIALRFSFQECYRVKRLYLMTLFPSDRDVHKYVSDEKLLALTVLNGNTLRANRTFSGSMSFDIPPVVNFDVPPAANLPVLYRDSEAQCNPPPRCRIDIEVVDVPPVNSFFSCLIL